MVAFFRGKTGNFNKQPIQRRRIPHASGFDVRVGVHRLQIEAFQRLWGVLSRLLGHERPDVTNIYLASVRKEAKDEH